jgi:outer membrane lipopolysaccharide assembly protein LptE/RlpB
MTIGRSSLSAAAVAIIVCLTAGCGYRLVTHGDGLLAGRQVAVAVFANKTYRPTIEGVMAKALRAELAAATSAHMAAEASADLLVSGAVERLVVEPVAFSAADRVREYRLAVTVSAGVTDRRSGQVLWQGRESAAVDYPASADLGRQKNAEEAAVEAACRLLAERLRLAMATGF